MADEGKGISLTDDEARSLAARLVADQAANHDLWLWWENLPMLREDAFESLAIAVENLAADIRLRQNAYDVRLGVDAAELLSRAQDGPPDV